MKASREQMQSIAHLLKRADFLRVQKQGRKWVSNGLILQALENGTQTTRFGITVSKKLDKRAVGRNRMRRRLRAAAYDIFPTYATPGIDFVIIGRHETVTRPYATLCEDIKWCVRKMDLGRKADTASASSAESSASPSTSINS